MLTEYLFALLKEVDFDLVHRFCHLGYRSDLVSLEFQVKLGFEHILGFCETCNKE